MKNKDLKEIKLKNPAELKKMVIGKKLDVDKLMVKIKSGEEKNLKKTKNLKKEIAQILTIIKEKDLLEKISEDKEENK